MGHETEDCNHLFRTYGYITDFLKHFNSNEVPAPKFQITDERKTITAISKMQKYVVNLLY